MSSPTSTSESRHHGDDEPLRTPVRFVRGVGPDRAPLLDRLGLRTVEDLLWNLPRDVLDLSDVRPVSGLSAEEVCSVRGRVVDRDAKPISGGRTIVAILLECDGGYVRGSWFNQPWRLRTFQDGQSVLFTGKPKRRSGRWEFNHPHVQWLDADDAGPPGEVLPRYGLTEGLRMHELRRIQRNVVEDFAGEVADPVPEAFRGETALPHLPAALRNLHAPRTKDAYEAARRRVIFDDLFEFQLALALRRRFWRMGERAPQLPATAKVDARIRRLFPFRFTDGQDAAVREITGDLESGRAMHRLLQADVGAGKTVVAVYAMLVAIAAGYQAALMAPTEVLANQHWQTIERLLSHSRVERTLLTGRLSAREREQNLNRIRAGEIGLVVGTQAVVQEDVTFAKLGLAVVDEQHKFGVLQRARFARSRSGDGESPHVLVMTATPIPRSLCLTQFGDLDTTTIRELPPGRQRVVTSRVPSEQARAKAWEFVRDKLRSGRQLYVICPRIEDADDETEARGAERVAEDLAAGELRDVPLALLHGRMSSAEKERVMQGFAQGKTRVLVSTTVVEVGVDVPNATLMVVYDASRFGLSQLHQLRGRIARGRHQGYCFLFSESQGEDADTRLRALEESSDGFRIAEADFELRGPGDVLGTRQSGQLPLRVADLVRDEKVLHEARDHAFGLVESGAIDGPDWAMLKVRVLERFGKLMDLPQSG